MLKVYIFTHHSNIQNIYIYEYIYKYVWIYYIYVCIYIHIYTYIYVQGNDKQKLQSLVRHKKKNTKKMFEREREWVS